MATIAIYGANGYVGDAIRTEAFRRGHEVLAFSRSGGGREGSTHKETLIGNFHDQPALRAVAQKADVLVIAVPARELDGKKLIDSVPNLMRISAETGTRVGFVGGAGSLRIRADGPMLMETDGFPCAALPEASHHARVLDALRETGKGNWFYLSPAAAFGAHMPQDPVGSYLIGGDVLKRDSRGLSAISARDFAVAFLDEVEVPAHNNARFSVVGAY